MKSGKKILVATVIFVISNLGAGVVSAVGSETPEIINYQAGIAGANDEYLVTGKTVFNSEVLIYIDGTFIDFAEIYKNSDGNFIFRYRLDKEIAVGDHKFMVIGRDRTSMVLSPPTNEFLFNYQSLPKPPAPTIVRPSDNEIIVSPRPVFTGLTKSGTKVRLYLDGRLVWKSKYLEHKSQTANFAFWSEENLEPGPHSLAIVAEDRFGQLSLSSKIVRFTVEPPLPAPVLVKTALVKTDTGNRVLIAGLAKNDLTIRLFVNDRLDGQFEVINHESGAANFSYLSAAILPAGLYKVYATAHNRAGKTSGKSNTIKFTISPKPIITPEAVSEEYRPEQKEPKEPEDSAKKDPSVDKEIEDIIKTPTTTKPVETGIVDEKKERQSKIKLNLVIFILFLLAVIGWIFWVNRELIKERKAQSKNGKK